MLKPAVIDLSHHNSVPKDLQAAKAAGILGLIHKASEGTGYRDSKLEARHWLAADAGLKWGVYHFLRPGSIAAQIDHFLSTIAFVSDLQTLVALDHEDPAVGLDDVVAFLDALAEAGFDPVLYSGHVLKEQLAQGPDDRLNPYRLWLAQYGPEAKLPPGFERYMLWQYTDKGTVPGVTPPTDLNAYAGTAEQLLAEWPRLDPTPPAPPPPDSEAVIITIQAPPGIEVIVRQVEP